MSPFTSPTLFWLMTGFGSNFYINWFIHLVFANWDYHLVFRCATRAMDALSCCICGPDKMGSDSKGIEPIMFFQFPSRFSVVTAASASYFPRKKSIIHFLNSTKTIIRQRIKQNSAVDGVHHVFVSSHWQSLYSPYKWSVGWLVRIANSTGGPTNRYTK